MRLNPHYPPYYLIQLGWAYSLTGRYAEAVATLKEATSRSPTHLAPSSGWLSATCRSGPFNRVRMPRRWRRRWRRRNGSLPSMTHPSGVTWAWATVYLWQKQYEQAIAEMERAIALDPNLALSYAFLAETLSRVGRPEEAMGMVEQALRLKPHVADLHLAA